MSLGQIIFAALLAAFLAVFIPYAYGQQKAKPWKGSRDE